MKLVKNSCFGGFSLSPLATKKYMERKGKECYFFDLDLKGREYKPLTLEEAEEKGLFVFSYTVPNPEEYRLSELGKDGSYKSANKRAESISTDVESRTDPDLIAVVEELGEKANGRCARLEIVEIPEDIEWVIDEYDGVEKIHEKHRAW